MRTRALAGSSASEPARLALARRSTALRVCVIANWTNPVFADAIRVLRARGVRLELLVPERGLTNLATLRVEHDLYVIKSGSELALSIAGALHSLGAATLNPYPAVALLRNKFIVTRVLQHARIPTPATYLCFSPRELTPLLEDGPVIVKPYRGTRGEGVRVIRSRKELAELPTEIPTLAQRYHEPDGPDHKLFCIGGALFGVRRRFPLRTYADKVGEPFVPDQELRDLAKRCGRAFGIDLFGMDVVVSHGKAVVVDVNKFGSYMGVPGAPRLLADYIHASAVRAKRGEPVTRAAMPPTTTEARWA